jgi:hypothetical protein
MSFRTVVLRSLLAASITASCVPVMSCSKKAAVAPQRISGYLGDADKRNFKAVSERLSDLDTNRKIIRHASLELLVDDIGQAVNRIRTTTDGVGGFVEKSSQTNTGSSSAIMTVRVPASRLDQAIAAIKGAAARVERENVEAKDVTREYIDLDARLRNTQAEEAQYLQIMKRASTVKDTLEVSAKLSDVRGRVEQLQGEMKYMTTQIAMSSLEISLHAEAEATVLGIHWRPMRQAKAAFVDMVSGLADWADSVVAFVINLPLIIAWFTTAVALIAVAWRVLRFLWRKLAPKTGWRIPWLRPRPGSEVGSS